MIAAVVLGLLIGLALGGLGGGGSILAVPVLVHLAGQSAASATATSLVAVGAASLVAGYGHARAGHVRWGAATAFVVLAVPGSWLGAAINARLDGDVLLLAFSGLVLLAAHRMLTACPTCTAAGAERALEAAAPTSGGAGRIALAPPVVELDRQAGPEAQTRGRATYGKVLVAATLVGLLTGLFGVGGGFVIVPALTLALGMRLPTAIGTSLAIIVGNSAVALAFRGVDAVDWGTAAPFAGTMLVGSALGAAYSTRLPAERTLQAFAGLLAAVAVANGIAAAWAI
jgi:uncharacterized membrane protein YfcA